jgi:hypothetical protein
MRKFTWVVLTNCDPAHDTEFNEWYDGVHIGDLLRIPGVVSAVRSRLAEAQMSMVDGALVLCGPSAINAKYKYLACYHIEAEDVSSVLKEVKARSNTKEMEISPYLTEAYTLMYEDTEAGANAR